MAAFKSLIDAECGTTNPLINLSHIYTRDNTHVLQDGLITPFTNHLTDINRSDSGNATADQFVQEYHRPLVAPNTFHLDSLLSGLRVSDVIDNRHGREWTREFFDSTSSVSHTPVQNQSYGQWNEHKYMPPSSAFLFNPPLQYFDQQTSIIHPGFVDHTTQAAQDILSYIQETQQAANTLMITETEDRTGADLSSLNDSAHYSRLWSPTTTDNRDFDSEYKFTNTNAFLDHTNPFEEGLKHLQSHDIVNAVLFFEAAVQKQSDHVNAWLYLGITQSENEQDRLAICALKKCVELDPKNLQAYIALSSCYANELLTDNAMDALSQWLLHNDKYSNLSPANRSSSVKDLETRFFDKGLFDQLEQSFLQAIASSPDNIDSDLQVCLGVLFHLSCDYDKAAQCFQTAVLVKPNDALLWNKLGAALANGAQSEKAIDAYYHALTLSPGFVRARYNLGISCFNLHAYTPAIEHFLTALKQQSDGIGPHGAHTQMSENIWQTLEMALGHVQRSDLERSAIHRDLSKLLKEFHVE